MKEKRVWTKWLYWFTFAVAVITVYKTLDNFTEIGNWISNFLGIIMPFIIGIIIAYILYIPARKIENIFKKVKKLKLIYNKARGLSVITVYILVILVLVLTINYIVPLVCTSVVDFVNNFQGYYNTVMEKINNLPDDALIKNEFITNSIKKIGEINIADYINMEKITKYAQGALSIATGIFNFFVSLIRSFPLSVFTDIYL